MADSDKLQYSTLLLELDVLLDTRLAILASMPEDALKQALSKDYHNRLIDRFVGVNNELFTKLYEQRDKKVLANALVTPIARMLKEFAQKTLKQIITTPFHYQPKIILNIYPYKLEEQEITVLINSIVTITSGLADVEVIDKSYEELTPGYLKKNVAIIVLYEYYKWIEAHSASNILRKSRCPEVTMLGPKIYFKVPEKADYDVEEAFQEMEEWVGPFIGLKLMPIENFSFVGPAT